MEDLFDLYADILPQKRKFDSSSLSDSPRSRRRVGTFVFIYLLMLLVSTLIYDSVFTFNESLALLTPEQTGKAELEFQANID
jgi:hypothetical protein